MHCRGRGIRGATTVESDTADAILTATCKLLTHIVEANDIAIQDIASAFFTITPDLTRLPSRCRPRESWVGSTWLCSTPRKPPCQAACFDACACSSIGTQKSPRQRSATSTCAAPRRCVQI